MFDGDLQRATAAVGDVQLAIPTTARGGGISRVETWAKKAKGAAKARESDAAPAPAAAPADAGALAEGRDIQLRNILDFAKADMEQVKAGNAQRQAAQARWRM